MTTRYDAAAEGRIVGQVINATPELGRFLAARARGASQIELMALKFAARITPARAAVIAKSKDNS